MIGVSDESKPVTTPLQSVDTWLPAVTEGLQNYDMELHPERWKEDTDFPNCSQARRERDVASFSQLLSDAFIEVATEEVKAQACPRGLGWRRHGFGEPPLSRFHAMHR